ncbi:hypothetical protein F5Y06DRAFT_299617 [Hypoxylon sp. FL0890]|nr:hypothetical protein F5Y06DRAFT_299617 [Hypoxylon sp. FL0890]
MEATLHNTQEEPMSPLEALSIILLVIWLAVGVVCGIYLMIEFFCALTTDDTNEETPLLRPPSGMSGYYADNELHSDDSDDDGESLTMPERQYLYNSGFTG